MRRVRIFNMLTRILLESGTMIDKVIAVDSTHIKAYSGRAMNNRLSYDQPEYFHLQSRAKIVLRLYSAKIENH